MTFKGSGEPVPVNRHSHWALLMCTIIALLYVSSLARRCKEIEVQAESSRAVIESLEVRVRDLEEQVRVLSALKRTGVDGVTIP